ncbi:MAG: hypothetical protein PR2021_5790 [Candidatus Phytoplasma pruni]|nr:hypothetical protein [Poinsettia branch-inducing phytoplasma]WEK82644.1 MAG: hypothetical protein PR2021_5790 [Candidatus Phytoplasma pruni]
MNEQAILFALNVHEQTHNIKEKPTKLYMDINSNGFADILYVEKPKKAI